jgi:hypothetical protein
MAKSRRAKDVFLNCPFDQHYAPLFQALVFATLDCGFQPGCALEADDGSEVRIDKIFKIVGECPFGVHDLCRTDTDDTTGLPRFNMPLELGIFLGAKKFGDRHQQKKNCLVLDSIPYRYQQFISDIAGQDIQAHGNDPRRLIGVIRNWLRNASGETTMPGGAEIYRRYVLFVQELPGLCAGLRLRPDEPTFNDYAVFIANWLRANL